MTKLELDIRGLGLTERQRENIEPCLLCEDCDGHGWTSTKISNEDIAEICLRCEGSGLE